MGHAATLRRTGIAVLCLAIAVALAGPVVASPEERRLEEVRDRLADVKAELEAAREARDARASAYEVARERVDEVLSAVGEAELAVERQQAAVSAAEAALGAAEDEFELRRQVTAARVASLYRNAGRGTLVALFASEDPGEVLVRSAVLEAVGRNDRLAFEQAAAARQATEGMAQRLVEERATLERVLEEQRNLLAEVEALREDAAIALAEQEEQVDELESHADHLAAEGRELAALAQRRAAASTRPSAPVSRSASTSTVESAPPPAPGGWQWPASGSVTSGFGMRWGRLHAGIDIAGARGSAIVAARGGTVTHAGRLGGYGNLVVINHGDGTASAYAHLSSIESWAGQPVYGGQRIGGMGCTGSCTGTHLHFEVRVNGTPQNPRNYLP